MTDTIREQILAIRDTGLLSPETDEKLKAALESFTKDFLKTKK